jgi:hypothetical protein
MRAGNDARDPLDDWLDRGIQPLQPPDGTFKAISRRARNRKMGKLVTAASCAAAVVVGTVLAVPSLLAPPAASPVSASSRAADRTSMPAPSVTPSTPAGTTNGTTPAPSTTGTIGAATNGPLSGYPAGGPVPDNFQPTSVTFIGNNTGWAIGQAGTPGKCANPDPYICTSMVLTQDGAKIWHGVPAPDTASVSGIRFYNGQDGWAYGPELWSTHDFGRTWQQVKTGGMVVTDLETVGGHTFAVFANCSTTTPAPSITFYGTERCTSFTLETTPAGSDNWTPVAFSGTGVSGTTLTMNGTGLAVTTSPTLVLQGDTGWFVGPRGQVFTGSLTSGTWTQASESPCAGTTSPAAGSAMLNWSLAASDLIMACNGQQSVTIFSSGDGAVSWIKQATAPAFGTANSLTASPAAPDILATTDGIEVLNKSTGQWQQVESLPGGFSYVGMTSDLQGVAVPATASLHQVWMTHNGGLSWTPSAITP